MTRVKIRHYVVKRDRQGFWQPTKKMRALGFYSVPCGKDGPTAWAVAERWNERWDKTRGEIKRGEVPSPIGPRRPFTGCAGGRFDPLRAGDAR